MTDMTEISPTAFKPYETLNGYPPIEDHGLIGDGATAALVGFDGAIDWLCVPRFDSPPLFCRLLDARHGGAFTVAPEGMVESRQFYEPDTAVLITEMRTATGMLELKDVFPFRSGSDLAEDVSASRHELLRSARVVHGHVRLLINVDPLGGAESERGNTGLSIRCAERTDLPLHLLSTMPLNGLRTVLDLTSGQSVHLLLCWGGKRHHHETFSPVQLLDYTIDAWRRWMLHFKYCGPQASLVRRSAITLKLLDYFENGAIVAAPTSSLPEAIGGPRNWDYRYAWIRDAAFSVYALHRVGLSHEASGFLGWVLDAVERDGRPHVLYNLDGKFPPDEQIDQELEGYRCSKPVRWGNAAAGQRQHDVYGEIIDCAYQWAAHHGKLDEPLWAKLCTLVEAAGHEWREPDHGIWEVRTQGRTFTYSAALCHVALERAARLADRFKLPGEVDRWRATAEQIRQAILNEAWNAKLNSLSEHLGGGGLDASLLALPLRRVISADHPKMVATTNAIANHLGAGKGLLYRYLPQESPDGLLGHEGAFLLCSFWLVDNLAKQGRIDEALALFDSLCARANGLGLLPEQIDPASGRFLGNYPQAFSHIGVISSGVNLDRVMTRVLT